MRIHVVSPVAHGFSAVRRALIGPNAATPSTRQCPKVRSICTPHAVRGERQVVQADVRAVIAVLLQVVEAFAGRLRERKLDQPAANEGLRMRIVAGRKEQEVPARAAARSQAVVEIRGDRSDVRAAQHDAARCEFARAGAGCLSYSNW